MYRFLQIILIMQQEWTHAATVITTLDRRNLEHRAAGQIRGNTNPTDASTNLLLTGLNQAAAGNARGAHQIKVRAQPKVKT